MCELFGANAKDSMQVNQYLQEFYEHSVKHPHGWGLACMRGNEVMIEKEPMQASKSNYLKERLKYPAEGLAVIGHIRYATIGNVEYKNCHPYIGMDQSGRRWTLAHNGTIFDFAPLHGYVQKQMGDTDSERILLYIIDQINIAMEEKGGELTGRERFILLDKIIVNMAKDNKLNLLIYDGEFFYVHTNYKNSLQMAYVKNGVLFSTQPLPSGFWRPVPFTQLLAFAKGRLVEKGTVHGKEYIDSEENLNMLYQIFSNL